MRTKSVQERAMNMPGRKPSGIQTVEATALTRLRKLVFLVPIKCRASPLAASDRRTNPPGAQGNFCLMLIKKMGLSKRQRRMKIKMRTWSRLGKFSNGRSFTRLPKGALTYAGWDTAKRRGKCFRKRWPKRSLASRSRGSTWLSKRQTR